MKITISGPAEACDLELNAEFDRQTSNLLQSGYPELARVTPDQFLIQIEPLRRCLKNAAVSNFGTGPIPFLIVIKSQLVATEAAMQLVNVNGKAGSVNMHPVSPGDFTPIAQVKIPDGMAYLIWDVDTGKQSLNITPAVALKSILAEHRLPLVIDEGVALAMHFPEVLRDKERFNCYSILGSRAGNQRVPAMWISYQKPRLGWCWDNNPHTWLGSASCAGRLGGES
ncbi:MAG: DUF5701 family protein [Planctomycetota bacterium]